MRYFTHIVLLSIFCQGCLSTSSPKEVMQTEQTASIPTFQTLTSNLNSIHNYVDTLPGKSEQQIINELGEPTIRDTWDYNGAKQTLLIYHLNNQSQRKLSLYFTANEFIARVVYGTINISGH